MHGLCAAEVDAAATRSCQADQQQSAIGRRHAPGACFAPCLRVWFGRRCLRIETDAVMQTDLHSCVRTRVAFRDYPDNDHKPLSEMDIAVAKASIAQRVEALDIPSYLEQHPPPYDVFTFARLPTRQCNRSAVAEYQEYVRSNGQFLSLEEADAKFLSEQLEANTKMNWRQYAIDSILAVIQAFDLVQIPVIAQHGTLLGWYRQCDVLAHTHDVDFFVPPGYIASMEHFELLQVGRALMLK